MSRLTVIGRGTAGCLTVAHFLKYTNWQVDWIFDPMTKPQAVGEGSNLMLPKALWANLGFNVLDLHALDGTFKTGLKKQNWGQTNTVFYHLFSPGHVGYHFTAVALQEKLVKLFATNARVRIHEQSAPAHDQIDSDYIIDCSGRPSDLADFHQATAIPVDSVYVTQCYWDHARFDYTLTIARPWGWVFGIPLRHRCAIGYMYNNTIADLATVQQDVTTVFDEYQLEPSTTTSAFSFGNYYRQENYQGRVAYNGNASFFLEPLEATSIHFMDICQRIALDVFTGRTSYQLANHMYTKKIQEIEHVIALHYLAGSVFDTEFWHQARLRAEPAIARALDDADFQEVLALARTGRRPDRAIEYGTWDLSSFEPNITALGIWDRLTR